jgi:hypothetical protein
LNARPRQTSVGDSKPFETPVKKKSAWKQLDLSAEKEPPTAAAAAVQLSPPANPWSRKTAEAAAPAIQRSPSDRINRSFADIMAEDAKVKFFCSYCYLAGTCSYHVLTKPTEYSPFIVMK